MKLTGNQIGKICDNAECGDYDVAKFSCYVDGIYTYKIEVSEGVIMEIGIIPFDNLECFLAIEELGRLLRLDFLFFDCNVFITDADTWERKEIAIVSINTNSLN